MNVLVADLEEDAAGFGEEVAGDGEAVTQVGEYYSRGFSQGGRSVAFCYV